jgi:subtilisin-like proprotein convertase family protein
VTLAAGTNDFAIYSRGGREYFLVENRQRAGRDASLPDAGLAIWHVDEDGDNRNEQMTSARHYELSLEQADGLFQLERQRNQIGDVNDLYAGSAARFADTTVPDSKWWNGTASNLTIDQISPSGPSMTFRCLLSDAVTPPRLFNPVSTPNRNIPDNNATGITDVINIVDALTISSIKVGVDITHSYRGDLRVLLTTPWGAVIELHPKGRGANADDLKMIYDETTLPALATLRGRSTLGVWRLNVQDLAPADVGRLNRWSLEITSTSAIVTPIELQESPGTPIPDASSSGIQRTLSATATSRIGSVEVSVDISHTWIGDLRVSVISPAGTEVVLHNRTGGSDDNLVRTFTPANTPSLNVLAGQSAAGPWRLRAIDAEADDVGKLNSWRVLIKPS